MLVRLGKPAPTKTTPLPFLQGGLPWAVALAAAVAIPPLLPIAASPVALVGFAVLIGALVMLGTAWLVTLLPILAVLGAYFLPLEIAGVNFYGFRLLLMLLAVFSTPLTVGSGWWFNPVAQRSFLFLILWFIYGILSLFWAVDFSSGSTEIVMIVFALAIFMTLFGFDAHKITNIDKLRFGWVVSFVFAGVVAFMEIRTGNHLESFFFDPIHKPRPYAFTQSTLGGPNPFGGYLLLVAPFVILSIEKTSKYLVKTYYFGLLLTVGILLAYSGSRLSLIGFAIQIIVYVSILQRRWFIPFVIISAASVATLSYVDVVGKSDLFLATKFDKVEEGSIGTRLALTVNGLWLAVSSAGIGVGAGGFERGIEESEKVIPMTIGPTDELKSHNFWVKVLAQYGVVIFSLLIALLVWIGIIGWRYHKIHARGVDQECRAVARAIVSGVIGYVFFGVSTGTVFLSPVNWMFLVSLMVMAAFVYESNRNAGLDARRAS